jgi:hypothetical protein
MYCVIMKKVLFKNICLCDGSTQTFSINKNFIQANLLTFVTHYTPKLKHFVAFSPYAKYTDRAIAACRRSHSLGMLMDENRFGEVNKPASYSSHVTGDEKVLFVVMTSHVCDLKSHAVCRVILSHQPMTKVATHFSKFFPLSVFQRVITLACAVDTDRLMLCGRVRKI